MSKRGQVTSFIIVGIMILFILAFTVYFISTIKDKQPIIDVVSDKTNLRACLEQALDLSISEVAEHGGSMTSSPNGTLLSLDGGVTQTDVRFGVRAGTPIATGAYDVGLSQFGTIELQSLCLLRGPNKPNAGRNNENDCLAGTYQLFQPDSEVLQYAIAAKASASAKLCGVESPVVITLGSDDVTAVAGNLSVKNDARLKRLYNAAFALAIAETKDVFFDTRSVQTLPGCPEPRAGNECLLSGMVLQAKSVANGARNGVSIIEITDTARKTPGPLTMRFAIENRAPLITSFTQPPAGQPFVVRSNDATELLVDAVDPDDFDSLAFGCQGPPWAYCMREAIPQGMRVIVTLAGCTSAAAEDSTVFVTISDGRSSTVAQFPVRLEPLPADQTCTQGTGVSKPTVRQLLRSMPSAAYLLDASISMQDRADDDGTKWDTIASYPFASEPALFIFNGEVNPLPKPITNPSALSTTTLGYRAPLYDAAWKLLQQDTQYDNITIVTDNADSASSKTEADVIAAANAKHTKLNVLVIGTPSQEAQVSMVNLAVQTGGTFFIRS